MQPVQARENVQPLQSTGKRATSAKHGKTCKHKARENVQPVQSAGKCPTFAKLGKTCIQCKAREKCKSESARKGTARAKLGNTCNQCKGGKSAISTKRAKMSNLCKARETCNHCKARENLTPVKWDIVIETSDLFLYRSVHSYWSIHFSLRIISFLISQSMLLRFHSVYFSRGWHERNISCS